MLRTSRWWARELERRERGWQTERAQLVSTICRLAGHDAAAPLPPPQTVDIDPEPEPDDEHDFVHPDFVYP